LVDAGNWFVTNYMLSSKFMFFVALEVDLLFSLQSFFLYFDHSIFLYSIKGQKGMGLQILGLCVL